MTEEDKDRIRKEILSQIEKFENSLESLTEQSRPVAPDRAIGRITRMDAIQQKNVAEAALRSAEESIYKLKETLPEIDTPGFGICSGCGGDIPIERILIVPESRLCVTCMGKKSL